jgi:tape measure domain-containing protein
MAKTKFAVETVFGARDKQSKAFTKMTRNADRFGERSSRAFRKLNKEATKTSTVIKGILGAQVVTKATSGFANAIKSIITESSKVEDAVASFQPLMGGVEQATKLVEKLNETAATTPFQFEGIASITKQLLPVMNGNIKDTIKTFRMLGDTAGGNIEKLESITRGYVKALLKGKPDMEALNMIAEAGVPIFSEMSKSMGITNKQLFELSKKGKLTNKDLTKAFERMTKKGGIFFEGMEIASKTLTGRFSTLKDNVSLTAATIGQQLSPSLKAIVDKGIMVAKTIRKWVTANKDLIKTGVDKFFSRFKTTIDTAKAFWKFLDNTGLLNLTVKTMRLVALTVTEIGKALSITWTGIKPILLSFTKSLKPIIDSMAIIIDDFNSKLPGAVTRFWETTEPVLTNFFKRIKPATKELIPFFEALGKLLLDTIVFNLKLVGKAFSGIWSELRPIVVGLSNFIESVLAITGIKGAITGAGGAIGGITAEDIGGIIRTATETLSERPGSLTPPPSPERGRNDISLDITGAPDGATIEQKISGAAEPINITGLGNTASLHGL